MPRLRFTALLAILCLAAPAARAETEPRVFDIIRHGQTIGQLSQSLFPRPGGLTEVQIRISVKVTVFTFTAYRFEQTETEIWEGDRLKSLMADSDDNGDRYKVASELVQGKLRTTVNGQTTDYPEMPPASLWRPIPKTATLVLDPTDGKPTALATTDAGWETITVRGKPLRARHVIWSGEMNRDLWYDASGALVQSHLKGDDGSDVVYVLR